QTAIAIQRALDGAVVAPDVRIGIHTGGAFHNDQERSDYGGLGVHVAARVGAAAGAGEILVSSESLEGVQGAFALSEPGEMALEWLADAVRIVSVDWRCRRARSFYWAVQPPSIVWEVPVTMPASSEIRKAASAATSSGSHTRLIADRVSM